MKAREIAFKILYDIEENNNYSNIASLIYDIEDILNNSTQSLEDLEWVSESIAEYNKNHCTYYPHHAKKAYFPCRFHS